MHPFVEGNKWANNVGSRIRAFYFQTNKRRVKPNFLGGGNYVWSSHCLKKIVLDLHSACLCCQRAQLAFTLSRRYRTCQCLFSLCYRTWLTHLRLSVGYHLVDYSWLPAYNVSRKSTPKTVCDIFTCVNKNCLDYCPHILRLYQIFTTQYSLLSNS